MLLDKNQFLYNKIADQLITNHLEKKIKFDVVEPDKIGSTFKSALEKEGALKELKSADWIIRFVEKIEAAPAQSEEKPAEDSTEKPENAETQDDTSSEEKKEETPSTDDGSDTTEKTDDTSSDDTETSEKSDAEADAENNAEDDSSESDEEEDKKKKEEVNESIKIQDLTKTMLLTPKKAKTSTPKTSVPKTQKSSCPKCEKKSEKKSCDKSEKKCCKKVDEAETTATGDELKVRVQKAVAKVFDVNKDEVDLVDVPDCLEGYNVYYCKLAFKDHEGQTEEPGEKEEK